MLAGKSRRERSTSSAIDGYEITCMKIGGISKPFYCTSSRFEECPRLNEFLMGRVTGGGSEITNRGFLPPQLRQPGPPVYSNVSAQTREGLIHRQYSFKLIKIQAAWAARRIVGVLIRGRGVRMGIFIPCRMTLRYTNENLELELNLPFH